MEQDEKATGEIRRLRRTMRDLVALSTLPAVWIGLGLEGILRSLADALVHTLELDLIYVRLPSENGESSIEVVRCPQALGPSQVDAVKSALAPLLSLNTEPPSTIENPLGGPALRLAVTRFGIGSAAGLVIAGSRTAGFPTEQDRLLLGVGANQTATVVERRRVEECVRDQEEWLRVVLASIGDAVIATDKQGRVKYLNDVAQALTGWTAAEAAGAPLDRVFVILNEVTREPVENPVEKVLREGTIVGLANHTILIAKDGAERPIDDSAAPIRDATGQLLGVVLTFRDVTEQRRSD
ncbi:MAG TPA: PAS domain-containing protein, partial [Prosthecobacter sp.]|nr:PAS domain-containing protein [Prosthecobacter sp.]